jgi:SH3-like domain-containing protein
MSKKLRYSISWLLFLFLALQVSDSVATIKSGKCEPYYVSIKSGKVNAHVGPGKIYKVVYEYTQKYLPVKVIAQYDNWRKVKDPDGDEVWIHKSLLSTKRFIITRESITQLMADTKETSTTIAKIKRNFVMELLTVRGNWCKASFWWHGKKFTGWVRKSDVFGVLAEETW